MICFLCSFSCQCARYCYCRPGWPVHVMSTSDMSAIDTSPPETVPIRPRRARSEPTIKEDSAQFIRFRSLRDSRKIKRVIPQASFVSIPSSEDTKWNRRKARRNRARARLESQLSSSSSSLSISHVHLPLLNLKHWYNSEDLSSGEPSMETQENPDFLLNRSRCTFDEQHLQQLVSPTDNNVVTNEEIDNEILKLTRQMVKETSDLATNPAFNRLELGSLSEEQVETLPFGWTEPVSYTKDMEQFAHSHITRDPFADPFEDDEEDRRSRTEMWVELTSGKVVDDDELEASSSPSTKASGLSMSLVPQVTIDECSENSLSDTSLSITFVTPEEPISKGISIQINGESFETPKTLSRKNSEDSSKESIISSDIEIRSLTKTRFRTNLDKALDKGKEDFDISEVDQFWNYRYNVPDAVAQSEERERQARELNRHRGHTPTVDRVVMYYTSDKRPSMTPSLSPAPSQFSNSSAVSVFSPSPTSPLPGGFSLLQSSSPNNSSSSPNPSTDLGRSLFIQVSSVISPTSPMEAQEERAKTSSSLETQEEAELDLTSGTSKDDKSLEGSKKLISLDDDGTVDESEDLDENDVPLFIHLDTSSDSDSDGGVVVCAVDTRRCRQQGRLTPHHPTNGHLPTPPQTADATTSTDDFFVQPFPSNTTRRRRHSVSFTMDYLEGGGSVFTSSDRLGTDVIVDGRGHGTQNINLLRDIIRQENMKTMNRTSPKPLIIESRLDDESAADKEVELRLFDGRVIGDIDGSSTEDLLAIDTRPNSNNQKSVSFSDNLNYLIHSPERRKSTGSNVLLHSEHAKSILKKDKQRESVRQMMKYAADRLYKDLRLLVEERDRSVHALDIVPATETVELSEVASTFQQQYRDKLVDNKAALDKRIDEVWTKLKEFPLDTASHHFVFGVNDSANLTLHVKRRYLARRHSNYLLQERNNKKSDLEMASDYASRLAKIRERMVRRDSEIRREDDRSIEDILQRVSRALYNK